MGSLLKCDTKKYIMIIFKKYIETLNGYINAIGLKADYKIKNA